MRGVKKIMRMALSGRTQKKLEELEKHSEVVREIIGKDEALRITHLLRENPSIFTEALETLLARKIDNKQKQRLVEKILEMINLAQQFKEYEYDDLRSEIFEIYKKTRK
jgi:hypothetical protein